VCSCEEPGKSSLDGLASGVTSSAASSLPPAQIPAGDDPLRVGPPLRPDIVTEVTDPLRIGPPRRPVGDPDP